MKTKELIRQLQEMDPEGELHVTGDSGAILDVQRMPGYYDGPGHYMEDSDCFPSNYAIDYKNDKVVITCISVDEFIWNHEGDYSKIDLIMNNSEKKDYIESFKKEADRYHAFHESNQKRAIVSIMERTTAGNTSIYQHKEANKYVMSFINLNKFKDTEKAAQIMCRKGYEGHVKLGISHLNQGQASALIESSIFERVDHGVLSDYYIWRVKQ